MRIAIAAAALALWRPRAPRRRRRWCASGTPRPSRRPSRRSTTSRGASRPRTPASRSRPKASPGTTSRARSWPGSPSGSPPELSHGQPITCTALQSKGLLLPLDEVVDAIGKDNIWEQVKRVCNVGGKQYGLVHAAGTSLLIYRKDLAEKAGLKPPKTWADLIANAKALTQSTKGDGKIDIYGITLPGDNLFINILMGELIKANGGALFDKANKPLLTDKKMIETLEFLRELVKYAPPGWEGHGYLQTFQNLYGQKAAMMFQGYGRGAGMIERFAPKEMANDKTFDVWVKPHGPSGNEPAAQVDEEPWMLFKDAKNTKEAIEFLKFFYQDDNYLEYVATVPIHLFPITKSLRNSAEVPERRDDPALEGLDRGAAAVSRQGPGQADADRRLGRHDRRSPICSRCSAPASSATW